MEKYKEIQITISCKSPEELSLKDMSSFLWDISTLFDKILLYEESEGKNYEKLLSPVIYTRRRQKPKSKIILTKIGSGSPELVLLITLYPLFRRLPEVIEALTNLLKSIRDWKFEKQRKKLEIEELRHRIKIFTKMSQMNEEKLAKILTPDFNRLIKNPILIEDVKMERRN